jgi:uncharacterized membrane protein YdjX (TVP38/TMEM64 family)
MAEAAAPAPETPAGKSGVPAARIIVLGVGLVVLALAARRLGGYVPAFAAWVADLGPLGPLVFVAGYAAAVVAFVPASILTLAAGAVFGIGAGVVYVFVAALLGSSLAFLVARHVARAAIEQRLAGSARFAAIDRAVGSNGLQIVFLLRLTPLVPFTLLNYALGLTRVRLRDYVAGGVGMLPGTLLYVYYGKVAGDVAALAGGAAIERGPEQWALLGVGLLATVAVTAIVTRLARRALAEAAPE